MRALKNLINTTFKKVSALAIVFILLIVSSFAFYIIPGINRTLVDERKYLLHEMSTLLTGILTDLQTRVESGELTTEEAQAIAMTIVDHYRYGKNGDDYFWINSIDTGEVLVHPYEHIRGTNLEDLHDENGYAFGAVMLDMARRGEEGYVSYLWLPKSDTSGAAVPKISHIAIFEPWRWVIGTGIYIDDLNQEIESILMRITAVITMIFLLLVGLLAFIITVGTRIERQRNIVQSEFVALIQHLPIGMFRIRLDQDSPPILWNNALINLLEVPHQAYFIKQNFDLSRLFKDESDAEQLRKILAEKKGVFGEEFQIKTFTDKIVWVRLYGKVIEKDNAMYFDASIENITDKKKAQNVLQKAYQELQETDHMKNDIISITSHELRTPLTIIKGFASILLNEIFGTLNDAQKKYANKILKNTNTMLDLITNMLDLEKLEFGKMQSEFERVNLNDLIERTYSDFRIRCVLDHKELIFHRSKPDITISTDPKHLSRIIMNLIDNAIKFTSPREGKIEIFVETPDADTVEIHVKDNGIGISAEDQKELFKKFAQIGGRIKRVSSGSGLGLPISKKLAQQIGGDLCVTSTPNKGSDFYVIVQRDNKS